MPYILDSDWVIQALAGRSPAVTILDRLAAQQVTLSDEPIMMRFAEVRSYLRRRGAMVSDFDMVIAATALHHNVTVLTFNLRHFQRIPDLRIYTPDT